MATYKQAIEMGIPLQKEWMATLDSRTRDSHGELDGTAVDYDKPFSNGLMYPGDPSGKPREIYNCRCCLVAKITGYKYKENAQTYKEWKAERDARGKQQKQVDSRNDQSYTMNRNMPGGLRRSKFNKLSNADKEFVLKEADAIGIDKSIIVFAENVGTGYNEKTGLITVSSQIFPSTEKSDNPIDRLSVRAVLAHEYYGHAAHQDTSLEIGAWNDEFRASYTVAKTAPNLSLEDRADLINAALYVASNAGVTIRKNAFMRKILYGI